MLGAHEEPKKDATRTLLQQICLQAKSAEGNSLLELIKQILEAPGIYVFAELLVEPNVQSLAATNAEYLNTLNLFAFGTYKQYLNETTKYLLLTPQMKNKLQHLTIVSLAIKSKHIPYSTLMEELNIDNVRHLEDLIIEAIYADIIRGKLFQNNRFLEIDYAQGRDIPPGYAKQIGDTLQEWISSCDAVSNCIAEQIRWANDEKSKKLKNREQMEVEINNLRKVLKSQTAENEEPMLVDSREQLASTSQEMRKKACKSKAARSSAGKLKVGGVDVDDELARAVSMGMCDDEGQGGDDYDIFEEPEMETGQ